MAVQRPNILFLIADDMPWKAVAALSGGNVETPNLDRLAERGTVFSHACNSGGYHGAVCVASRTMLNTAKQLWRAGPGIPAGGTITAPIYLRDIVPTTLELAGAKIPEDGDFESLLPHLRGEGSPRKRIHGAHRQHQRMIRKGDHKLIVYPEGRVTRVFDLSKDPHEMGDLAQTPEGRVMIAALFPELLDLQREMNDPLDLAAVFPDLAKP